MLKKAVLAGLIGISSFSYANVNVIVSILPQQTFVQKIGGDKVNVTAMVKPGSNPHSYEPKPSQMRALSKADVYFPINLEFENAWLDKFAQQNQNMQFFDMTEGLELMNMVAHTHSHHKSSTPYEWTGLFELQKGKYQWSFSKVAGQYADPAMKFLIIEVTDKSKNPIDKYKTQAKKLFDTNTALSVKDRDTLTSNNGYYLLNFDAQKEKTVFNLDIKKDAQYLFFTQHFPSEFKDKEHFLKDVTHKDIKPTTTSPKAESKFDPHTWTSPANVTIMAKNIYNTLVKLDKDNEAYYRKNYENFIEEIELTDKKIRKILSSLPNNSKIMVFHPSWGYFARDYGLTQLTIEVEGKEPKPKMLEKIIKKAKQEKVKAIFTQVEFSDKSAKAIANELNIKVLKETPLAKEWSNNLIKIAGAIANNS
ncbi:MAG: zinc ABC transporter substrate-binding protein [Campylobacterota bacterium]|nr:zinc ABC transporter substrate-binding protein [Campylobacterota bacterium]